MHGRRYFADHDERYQVRRALQLHEDCPTPELLSHLANAAHLRARVQELEMLVTHLVMGFAVNDYDGPS
jgi:hypothetical protein